MEWPLRRPNRAWEAQIESPSSRRSGKTRNFSRPRSTIRPPLEAHHRSDSESTQSTARSVSTFRSFSRPFSRTFCQSLREDASVFSDSESMSSRHIFTSNDATGDTTPSSATRLGVDETSRPASRRDPKTRQAFSSSESEGGFVTAPASSMYRQHRPRRYHRRSRSEAPERRRPGEEESPEDDSPTPRRNTRTHGPRRAKYEAAWEPHPSPVHIPQRSRSVPSRDHHAPPDRTLPTDLTEARSAMMVMWLYQGQLQRQYTSGVDPAEGVVLKIRRSNFTCCPASLQNQPRGLFEAVQKMNVRCAMTVNTIIVRALTEILKQRQLKSVPLEGGLQVQILPSFKDLPGCQLHHFAAFIEDKKLLVVWDDNPKAIFNRAHVLEEKAMSLIWRTGDRNSDQSLDDAIFKPQKDINPDHTDKDHGDGSTEDDLEQGAGSKQRPIRLASAFIVGFSLALCISAMGIGWRTLARDSTVEGDWTKMAILVTAPPSFFFSLFFFYSLVSNIYLMLGSSKVVRTNSKYYSGLRPKRSPTTWAGRRLPHVTIQMPVYKEGLQTVIQPTVMSLKTAISTYEMQGGSANIFINDDGIQLLSSEKIQERRDFYDEHNIGWVARPRHNPPPSSFQSSLFAWATRDNTGNDDGRHGSELDDLDEKGRKDTFFIRRGKFKKASNMNYALHVSNRLDAKLQKVHRPEGNWSWAHEDVAYNGCLAEVLQEDRGRTWAEGNILIGDYILVVDSDTRVPVDCLLDSVTEMDQSPEVAILQHTSGVMQLTDSYFENGIAWFANLIYSAITFAVASGDCCPFVGHNAMLRWAAIQDAAAYHDDTDGHEKYWSESHVSEDFDMAIRLQMAGWVLRYVSYTGTAPTTATGAAPSAASESFAEGVSLTVYDELARWEKYAYGCSELLFNPLWRWPTRGPFTRRFVDFVCSRRIRLPVKLTVASYMGSYYAISMAWIIGMFNYLFMGWFSGLYRSYYLDSFAIYISLLFVFPCLGNIALAVHRYRLGQKDLIEALWENFKWVPMFTIFLGGISLHISQAIAAHLLGIDMVWGSTAKEVDRVSFFDEMARILRRFRWTFLLVLAGLAAILACRFALPREWQITEFFAIFPLATVLACHFALPVLLNPALMTFTW